MRRDFNIYQECVSISLALYQLPTSMGKQFRLLELVLFLALLLPLLLLEVRAAAASFVAVGAALLRCFV